MAVILSLLALMWIGGAIYVAVGAVVLSVERQRPPERSAEALARYAREVSTLWLHNLLTPFCAHQPDPRPTQHTSAGVPVLLLPGYGRNRACLLFLAAALRRRGWRWVWPVNHRGSSIPELAGALSERVDQLLRHSGAEQVDLIAHSMGGVVASWYINQLGGRPRVRRLVTIATPWGGTRLAALAGSPLGRELMPSSPVIAALAPPGVPSAVICTDTDTIVVPPELGRLEAPGVALFELPGMGHEQLLLSPRVLAITAEQLSAPGPA